jgi:tetratricopeptide (TPR) repeat protein
VIAAAGCASPPPPAPEPPLAQQEALDPDAEAEANLRALEAEADHFAALGRRDQAAPLYEHAIAQRLAGDARAPDARALTELAVIEHARGHAVEAEHFYRRALAAEPAEGGADPDLRNIALANLGWLLGERAADEVRAKRANEALASYEQALAIWEELAPASDELVAETLANLALLRRARGEREPARALLERALPLYEKTRGGGDPTVLRVRALIAERATKPAAPPEPDPAEAARDLDREGAAHLDRREYVRARALLERAVSIHERGVTAPVELGASLSYLGRTYAALGDRENASYVLQRSLAILEPTLGKLDPLTLATRASLENVRGAVPANAAD